MSAVSTVLVTDDSIVDAYARARAVLPTRPLDVLEALAEQAHDCAARSQLFPDPRHLVIALGLRLLPRLPIDAAQMPGRVTYAWHPHPQVRGPRVLLGLARCLLLGGVTATDADVWAFAMALLVPRRSLAIAAHHPAQAAAHAPSWLVGERLKSAKSSRVAGF